MIKIRTYNINTDEKGDADLSNSHVKFLSPGSSVAWTDLIHILAEGFLTAQLTSNFSNQPFRLSLVFTHPDISSKFKPEDHDKIIDYIDYLINCMEEPSCGIIITLYQSKMDDINVARNRFIDSLGITHDINFPWAGNAMWPFKKEFTYKGYDSNYVAVNITEIKTSSSKLKHNKIIENKLFKKLENLNLNYKYFSYSTSMKETIDTIINSKIVLCYDGGSTTLTAITKTPYISWGNFFTGSALSGGGVGRSGSWGVNPTQILTYDINENLFKKENFGALYGIAQSRLDNDIDHVYTLLEDLIDEN